MAETTALVGGFARAIRAGQEKHGQGKTPASPDTSPVSADADKENRAPLADGKATSVVNCKATTPLMVRKTPSNRTTRRQPLAPLSPAVSSPLLTCHKKVTAVDNDKPVVARRKSTRVQVVANRNSSTAQEATPKLANVASSTGVSAAASSSKKASEMPVTNKNKHSATEKPKTMHKANKTSVAPKLNSSAKKSMLPRPNITTATTTRERRTAACKPVNYAEPRLGT